MSDKDPMDVIFPAVLAVAVVFAMTCWGYTLGERATQNAAVRAGAGCWAVDAKTGQTKFRFIARGPLTEH